MGLQRVGHDWATELSWAESLIMSMLLILSLNFTISSQVYTHCSLKNLFLNIYRTWIWSLIWEDPTCHGAAKPGHQTIEPVALEPWSRNYLAHMLQLLKLVGPRVTAGQQEDPLQWEGHPLQLESSPQSPQLEGKAHGATKIQHSQK